MWKKRAKEFAIELKQTSLAELEEDIASMDSFYKELFDLVPRNSYEWIMKCDLARYIYAYEKGSGYSDLDLLPKKELSSLSRSAYFENNTLVFAVESILDLNVCAKIARHPLRGNRAEYQYRLANFLFFVRKKKHPLWLDGLRLAHQRLASLPKDYVMDDYSVLYLTGPDLLTEAIMRNIGRYDDIGFIPHSDFITYFEPLNLGSWRANS